MNEKLKLDITEILIIVHKNESENFVFKNSKRDTDGFVLFTSGTGYYTNSQGKRYKVSKGDAIITKKDDNYCVEAQDECSYITSGLILDTDKSLLPTVYKCGKKEYEELIEICEIWQSRSWDSYAKCRIKLMEFYLNIINTTATQKGTDNDIKNALEYIHNNFKTNFSGQELADFCSISVSHLRNKFLRQTGYTIVEYRNHLRVAAAKEMLRSGCFTVTEIATGLGYCDVYHFSKCFSLCTGYSPTKWLNKFNA